MNSWLLALGALVVAVALVAWLSPQTLGLGGGGGGGGGAVRAVSAQHSRVFAMSGAERAANLTDFSVAEAVLQASGLSVADVASVTVQSFLNDSNSELVRIKMRDPSKASIHGIALIKTGKEMSDNGEYVSNVIIDAVKNAARPLDLKRYDPPGQTKPIIHIPQDVLNGYVMRAKDRPDHEIQMTVFIRYLYDYPGNAGGSLVEPNRRPTGWLLKQ